MRYGQFMGGDKAKRDGQLSRDERLKAALKANLGRRKAQARARSDETGDKTTRGAAESGTAGEADKEQE